MKYLKTLSVHKAIFFILILSLSYTIVLLNSNTLSLLSITKIEASADNCPGTMPPQARLDCLNKEAIKISSQQGNLKKQISAEQYQQLSLNEQIAYLNSDIARIENKIAELEIEIETKNVEIRILGKEIEEIQNKVNTMSQEMDRLQNSVDTRVNLSYKYSFITPVEIFLENANFENLLRKIKYLAETRKKDKELLSDMFSKSILLQEEEKVLGEKQNEVLEKRKMIEEEKSQVFKEKEKLSAQKDEQANLLAISRQKINEYNASFLSLKKQYDTIASQVDKISSQMPLIVNKEVKGGDIIGRQGHTGLAFGSHLHFNINAGNKAIYENGYFVAPASSGTAHIPLDGAQRTQGYHWGYSLDFKSVTSGDQGGNSYFVKYDSIKCTHGLGNHPSKADWLGAPNCTSTGCYFGMQGEGAYVRAIADGKVTSKEKDICGGNMVRVLHPNGDVSLYLHLQPL